MASTQTTQRQTLQISCSAETKADFQNYQRQNNLASMGVALSQLLVNASGPRSGKAIGIRSTGNAVTTRGKVVATGGRNASQTSGLTPGRPKASSGLKTTRRKVTD